MGTKSSRKQSRKKRKCGSKETASARPCRISIDPCPLHFPDGKRRPRNVSARRINFAKAIAEGKSPAEAGREAGYSDGFIKSRIYTLVKLPDIQGLIERFRQDSPVSPRIHRSSKNAVALDQKGINQARAYFLAEVNDLVNRSRDLGEPLTTEQSLERLKPVFEYLEGKSVIEAAFSEIGSIKDADFNAAVQEWTDLATKMGIPVTREMAVARLHPWLQQRAR